MPPQVNFLVGTLTTPSNVLCFLLVLGCAWLIVSRRRRGFRLVLASTAALLAIAVLPISSLLVMPLENRFPPPVLPDHVDGIVVLGGSVAPFVSKARGRPAIRDASDRLFATIALARKYPDARLILAGGTVVPRPGAIPESWIMRDVLSSAGISGDRLELETRSRNTYENAQYAYDMARPAPGQVWILITSGNHMPRAVGCFRQVGFTVLPYPVDYLTTGKPTFVNDGLELSKELRRLDIAIHEWIGLIGYRMLGWTDDLFPHP